MIICAFFFAHLIYFGIFSQYRLAFQEQIQLFRFDWDYLAGILIIPGGFAKYSGAFFTQFYISPLIGGFIVTMGGIAIYALSGYIFRKYRITEILWALIPVLILVALQSDPYFVFSYSVGLNLALAVTAIYISIHNDKIRYAFGIAGWSVLYLAAGGFSLLAIIIFILHELLFTDNSNRFIPAIGYTLLALLIPYIAWYTLFHSTFTDIWLNPVIFPGNKAVRSGLLVLVAYFPVLLVLKRVRSSLQVKTRLVFKWNWKNLASFITVTGILFILSFPGLKSLYLFNRKNEILLGTFKNVQLSNWAQVLKLSSRYRQTEPFVVFFTNLALYKSGHLGDRMFYYNQTGPAGLCPEWEEDNVTPFFGSEVFYQLGYSNEAYRWSFEAMVATGQSPYLLKRLVMTSLINGNYTIAEKYLHVLDQTLFYRKWAQHYLDYLVNPSLLLEDKEIREKRNLLIYNDFFADLDNFDFNLAKLLENHPDNRMAFEYFMASLLLEKRIDAIAVMVNRLKDYGYKEIPLHYEEALILYMANTDKDAVPEGYRIRESTIRRFNDYINVFTPYLARPKIEAAEALGKDFGNTYWFYSQFYSTQ